MKETLARLGTAWRNLPQSTKILLAGLLLVSAVTLWYVGFYLPAQVPGEVQAPPTAPTAEAEPRAIEAPPIPPLAESPPTPQPEPRPAQPPATSPPSKGPSGSVPTTALPLPQPSRTSPPPNPFVPLVVEAPTSTTPPAPAVIPRPQPVPTGAPVRVSAGTPLPSPGVPTSPQPLPGTAGALPAPKVLAPALRAEVPRTRAEPQVALTPPTGLVESPLPEESPTLPLTPQTPIPSESPKTPLQTLVEERGLRLSGTLLGPVSVAILESKEGYLVLPVGSPIPGSEAVVRRVEGDRVVLTLKEETLEISLTSAQAGGGQ